MLYVLFFLMLFWRKLGHKSIQMPFNATIKFDSVPIKSPKTMVIYHIYGMPSKFENTNQKRKTKLRIVAWPG